VKQTYLQNSSLYPPSCLRYIVTDSYLETQVLGVVWAARFHRDRAQLKHFRRSQQDRSFRMLCQICQRIFCGPCSHSTSAHHLCIDELEQSASESCPVCRVLWTAVSDRPPANTKEIVKSSTIQTAPAKKPISRYHIKHCSDLGAAQELSFVVDKDGVNRGGSSFEFHLLRIEGETGHTFR
jgi:hypothetical protein